MNRILRKFLTILQGFLLLNLIWYMAHISAGTAVIPSPIAVYRDFGGIFTDKVFIHILYSLKRVGIGLALSLAAGIPLGILMAYSGTADRILNPLVYFSYPIPKTALLPVAMLVLGMRDSSKVAVIFFIIVFQVIVSVRDSVRNIEPDVYQAVISAGAGKPQIIRYVTLPAILPELLTSIRISLGTAVTILFFVEGYGTKYGMGYYILDAWSRINYIDMYIGIIVISIVGFLLFITVDMLSGLLCRWVKTTIN